MIDLSPTILPAGILTVCSLFIYLIVSSFVHYIEDVARIRRDAARAEQDRLIAQKMTRESDNHVEGVHVRPDIWPLWAREAKASPTFWRDFAMCVARWKVMPTRENER